MMLMSKRSRAARIDIVAIVLAGAIHFLGSLGGPYQADAGEHDQYVEKSYVHFPCSCEGSDFITISSTSF
jgi:hypothetical protein